MHHISSSNGFILATQPNFRDLGGIPVAGGKCLRHGMVFRSGDLSGLDAGDVALLEAMKLRSIVDFRSDREVEKRPDVPIGTVVNRFHFPIEDAAREMAVRMFEERDAEGLRNLLTGDYRRMISGHSGAFRDFFRIVSEPENYPLVFHCAAGKDRTGMAAWFLLSALGTPEELIRRNYNETNHFTREFADRMVRKTNEKGLHGELLRPMLEVRDEYIDAALEVVDKEFGGMERYLRDELQINPARLQFLVSGL